MPLSNPFHPIVIATTKSRIFGLDLLRAMAISLVLYGHCVLLFPEKARGVLFRFFIFDPVTLFFVLSGFLIGRILVDTFERETLKISTLFNFWLRRWMRTVPAYLATLLLLAFVYHKYDIRFLLRYVFFLQNFNWPHPEWFPEAWSLTIEEWFYFLIPLLMFGLMAFLTPNIRRVLLGTCLAIMILTPLYRWFRYETIQFNSRAEWDYLFRMQVLTRLDSIMYGVLGAYLFRFQKSIWSYSNKLYLCIGLALVCITYIYNQAHVNQEAFYSSVLSFSVESFAFLLLIPFFASLKTVKGKIAKAVTVVSIMSYSLYLLNMSFVSLYVCYVVPQGGLTGWWLMAYKVVVYWVVTLSSATILYLTVEHPFMVIRDRVTKVKRLQKPP